MKNLLVIFVTLLTAVLLAGCSKAPARISVTRSPINPVEAQTKVGCVLAAYAVFSKINDTHANLNIAVKSRCPDGTEKIYRSRSAIVDLVASPDIGAKLLSMMAEEVSKQMAADGAKVPADEIVEHLQLSQEGA